MKNILVPTDLSQQSLEVVHQIVDKNKNQPVNIHLVHMVKAPNDLSDLLFLKKSRLYDQVPCEFFKSIDNLRNAYPSRIHSIRFEFYYGSRASILNSIVENLDIEEICVLNDYNYSFPLESSVNIVSFIDRCDVPVFKASVFGKVVFQKPAKKSSSFSTHESLSTAIQ